MTKAASASAHLRAPGMQKALAQLVERPVIGPRQRTILAERAAEMAGLRRPLISPEVHANLVKASGLSTVAERIRTNGALARISERAGAQIQANLKQSGIGDQLAAHIHDSFKTSRIADQVAEQWRGRLQEIALAGPNASMAAAAGAALANMPDVEAASESVADAPEDQVGWYVWFTSLPLIFQIVLLLPWLAVPYQLGYFLEDVTGEDIPDAVQSGGGALLALAVALAAAFQARSGDQ